MTTDKITYIAYVETTRLWESHANCVSTAEFNTYEEAHAWLDECIDAISNSDSDFVGDYGIRQHKSNAAALLKLAKDLDNM